ncbi:hypothetical protein IGJ77_003040 [Enterococcus sp. AZ147]
MEIERLFLVISLLMDFLSLPPEKMVITTILMGIVTLYWIYTDKKNSFN